jgi:hypothetical protein
MTDSTLFELSNFPFQSGDAELAPLDRMKGALQASHPATQRNALTLQMAMFLIRSKLPTIVGCMDWRPWS